MTENNDLAKTIRKNTIILSTCMGLSWAVVQLVMALSAIMLTLLTHKKVLGGIAPALYLVSWAVTSLYMGRFMDKKGRGLGLRIGFATGTVGALVVFFALDWKSIPLFLLGLVMFGICGGTANLSRAGAADMYPAARRARGISYVLLGAAFGAILSPIAFAPLLQAAKKGGNINLPWLVAAGLLFAGVLVTLAMRMDPREIARMNAARKKAASEAVDDTQRPLGELLEAPGVTPALIAAVLSQGVMTALMSITGVIMVGHGHELSSVSIVMGFHFLGMFGLVLVAGQLVDRIGRTRSIVFGLVLLAGSVLVLLIGTSLGLMITALFGIGLGWNFSFVASTAELTGAAKPLERARLLGFNDFTAILAGAIGSAAYGAILGTAGLLPLAIVGAVFALVPILWMLPGKTGSAQTVA